jgi:hypothetical protein
LSIFDAAREVTAGAVAGLHARDVTLFPMRSAPPAGKPEPDPTRAMQASRAIRSQAPVGIDLSGEQSVGRGGNGNFRTGAASVEARATFQAADLGGWQPRVGDDLVWADRPDERWRIARRLPLDGGQGGTGAQHLAFALNKVG